MVCVSMEHHGSASNRVDAMIGADREMKNWVTKQNVSKCAMAGGREGGRAVGQRGIVSGIDCSIKGSNNGPCDP